MSGFSLTNSSLACFTGVALLEGAWQATDLEVSATEAVGILWCDFDCRGGPSEMAANLGLAEFIWHPMPCPNRLTTNSALGDVLSTSAL